MRFTTIASIVVALAATGCELDVPDLNNPGIDELEENPTRVTVGAAATGLLIGNRANTAQANGLVAQLGILGREAYNFDQADPRFIGELLQGQLNPGSPFGGNFWLFPYANIRIANIIERVAANVSDPEYSTEELNAVLGFARTIEALDLLVVVDTRDTNGGVIDTDRPLEDGPGAMVGRDELLAEIAALLDEGADELAAGGAAFPFNLSRGYAGFDTPPTFLTFNRAIRARVAVYQEDFAGALTALAESFIDIQGLTIEKLNVGVYHSYSTGSGDTVNNLINPNIYVHPSVAADVQAGDDRLDRKTEVLAEPASAAGLSADRRFTIYPDPDSPVPIIRNEELILLRAEARLRTADLTGAEEDLNLIRTISGALPALTAGQTEQQLEDEIVYNRRYSLLFEGHRLIDVRRLGRTAELPLDVPTDPEQGPHVLNVRWPIPSAECNARGGAEVEPRCGLGSQD
jgi:starch-binding outer membrane protein, SusD/RagB family